MEEGLIWKRFVIFLFIPKWKEKEEMWDDMVNNIDEHWGNQNKKKCRKMLLFLFLNFFRCYSLFEIWGWNWVLEFKCLIFWNWRKIMNSTSIFSFFALHVAIVFIFLMIFFFYSSCIAFNFLSLRESWNSND